MCEFVEVQKAVEMFAHRGHAFYPARHPGVGYITVVYIGSETYYVQCNSKDFCKRLIKWFCMSERLLTKFAYELLGQRKHTPLVLQENMTLTPFWYPRFESRSHRTAYVSLFSFISFKLYKHNSTVTLILKDNHTLDLPYSFQRVQKQLIQAEYALRQYLNRIQKDDTPLSPIAIKK
jgi:hypothetical protein